MLGRVAGLQLALGGDDLVEGLALDEGPGQVVHAAGGAHVHEGHDGRVLARLEGAHLAAGDADVPHAPPRQHLDGVPLVVGLRLRLVDRAHAAGAQGVHQGERPEHEALGLALEEPVGLELAEDSLADQVFGQRGRLRAGIAARIRR